MKSFFLTPEQYSDLKGRYAKFNEPWTEEEAEELKQMAADGVARAEMSAQLGRSPNAIKLKLQSLGLYVPKPASKPWTPEDEHSLVKLYREGVSFGLRLRPHGRRHPLPPHPPPRRRPAGRRAGGCAGHAPHCGVAWRFVEQVGNHFLCNYIIYKLLLISWFPTYSFKVRIGTIELSTC